MTRRDGADAFRTTATPVLVTSVLVCALGCWSFAATSETAATAKGQPPCLMLPVGSVQPRGWMLAHGATIVWFVCAPPWLWDGKP
jgi:hypothetical protein